MKKTIGTILIALVVLVLLGGIFAVVNSFTGNPVSAALAGAKIRQYAAQTYPSMSLSLSPASYSMKANGYVCHAQSTASQDTKFAICYSRGRVSDDYAYEVANHFTTYRRLSSDFDDRVTAIIQKNYPNNTAMILGDLRGDTQLLTPDAPLDLNNMPLDMTLTVYMTSDTRDTQEMATRLLELHQLMLREGIAIDLYSLVLEEPLSEESKPGSGDNLHLTDFPATAITDDVGVLQAAIEAHRRAVEEKDKP